VSPARRPFFMTFHKGLHMHCILEILQTPSTEKA
jgi:hypothetical protein